LPMYGQYAVHMQEFFSLADYREGMAAKCNLRNLREAARLSVRELARL